MKRILLAALLLLPFPLLCQEYNIIPYPSEIEKKEGHFMLDSRTVITHSQDLISAANQLKAYLDPATGFNLLTGISESSSKQIQLALNENLDNLGNEGYILDISSEKIRMEAFHSRGLFYAFQTLLQLLPNDILREAEVEDGEWLIPNVSITDVPQFEWRGLMIDYSRTFWNKRITKKYIDALAFYKLNKLHMHLTDDQGWRIEIARYPLLTEYASKFDTSFHEAPEREGYFSKADMKELIKYAEDRNVELIPEIEMPGHSSEVFSVYPELSCKGDTTTIHTFVLGPGIHKEIFCAGNDGTFVFLKNVLSEIAELFPSKYIHIGGDEAPKDHWKECPKCQQRIEEEGLKDEHALQSWFIKEIEAHLTSQNKTMIGWDEIMEGGLSESATVMYWRGWMEEVPRLVLDQGNDIILSPTTHFYFDYTYETTSTKKVYAFNPLSEEMSKDDRQHILGVQANFWSHLNRIEPEMDRQIFPRILALAEVGWSEGPRRNWEEFALRLHHHFTLLDIMDIHYFEED